MQSKWLIFLLVTFGTFCEASAQTADLASVLPRQAVQRAMTEAARTWHAKLAADFAERAQGCIIAASA